MDEVKDCARCNEPKPFPAEFIMNYLTMKKGNTCIACRKILRKEQRRKLVGKPETKSGWRDAHNNFKVCQFPKKRTKDK